MSATGALIFYSLFVMSAQPDLVTTIPLVMFGLFRYFYISSDSGLGESPTEVLLTDKQLLVAVGMWVALSVWEMWPV